MDDTQFNQRLAAALTAGAWRSSAGGRTSHFDALAALLGDLSDAGGKARGALALNAAIYYYNVPAVEWLVRRGVDPAAAVPNSGGCTPLRWACILGRWDIARRLVGMGADLFARDYTGRTPLLWARDNDAAAADELLAAHAAEHARLRARVAELERENAGLRA